MRPGLESLEGRQLLATLGPIADVNSAAGLGYQLPLEGGNGGPQTYSVTSSNPNVIVTPAQGQFWTVAVSHESSGPGDPSFVGSLTFQLFEDLTPNTVQKITELIESGFYTSPTQPGATGGTQLPHKNFHRIVDDFVAQGGSLTGNGQGNLTAPGFPFADEFNQQLVFNGTYQLAMANAGDDTNDSQFFVTYSSTRNLDFNHTIFGQLVSGQETLALMEQVARTTPSSGGERSQPINPVLITSSTLSDTNPDGVLHINTTGASIGETSVVAVTATDSGGGTVTRTFRVNVTANVDSAGRPFNEPAFLNPTPNYVVATNQPAVFQLTATNPEPEDTLTYVVAGGVANGAFTQVSNATASVDSTGVVTVTPNTGFTGVINLLVGVRDDKDHGRTDNITDPGNYDTQKITVTVRNGAVVNLQPIAVNGTTTVEANQESTVQLPGLTANPTSSQTLTFALLSGPQHGTITDFDPTTGTFKYTPTDDFLGSDTVQFQVTDVGDPTPNLTSAPGVLTIQVSGSDTGSVRVIDRVLIVTPPPRTDGGRNTVSIERSGNNVQVRINGLIESQSPAISALDRVVVYGTKADDFIAVADSIDLPATLSGGLSGRNILRAGGGVSRLHGWFGNNSLTGGPADDFLFGRTGHVRFRPSAGRDLLFAGNARPGRRGGAVVLPSINFSTRPQPPTGTFYRFVNGHAVPVSTPPLQVRGHDQSHVGAGHARNSANTSA
jgi:cyclophilin family peptidyl-prolyl cis-trans isomerase